VFLLVPVFAVLTKKTDAVCNAAFRACNYPTLKMLDQSLDHFVGTRDVWEWHCQVERLGGLQIDGSCW